MKAVSAPCQGGERTGAGGEGLSDGRGPPADSPSVTAGAPGAAAGHPPGRCGHEGDGGNLRAGRSEPPWGEAGARGCHGTARNRRAFGGRVWVLLARSLGAGLGLTLLPSPLLPGVRFEPRRCEASRGAQLQAVTCLSPKRRSCCLPSGADLEISAQAEPPGRQSGSELCSSKPRTRFSPQRRRLRGCLLLQRIYRLLAPSLPAPR